MGAMSRSSHKRSGLFNLPLPLAIATAVLLAFLVSSMFVFNVYSDELKQAVVSHHWVDSTHLRRLNGSQSPGVMSRRPQSSEASTHGEAGREQHEILTDEVPSEARGPLPASTARVAVQELRRRSAPASVARTVTWKLHRGKSCQGFAGDDSRQRPLEDSKDACSKNDACVAIACPTGQSTSCTLRAVANLVDYGPEDCYERLEMSSDGKVMTPRIHPEYNNLLKQYPFQQVTTQSGNQVNIMLVRSAPDRAQQALIKKYGKDILFIGISSMNDYPLSDNPSDDYVGMFPGFLHMMREPEKAFPPHVKTLLMSQSDFQLPDVPARDYSVPRKYDFTYSASDCDVLSDGHGWCGWSKNWSFVKEALPLMCGELNLTGVLVATKDKSGRHAYTIPGECKGKMTQTTYLQNQQDYFNYLKQSRFAFLPQIHDASPRVSTQALAHDVPILMNYHIKGGWKYVTPQTGEFFHDMGDFKQSLLKILKGADVPHHYEPRKWVKENYGNRQSGERLLKFILDNFGDRVTLPRNTKYLQI